MAFPQDNPGADPFSPPRLNHHLHGIQRNRFMHRRFHFSQWIPVAHEFAQRVMFHVTSHLPHARTVAGRFLAAHAQNAHALRAQETERVDSDLAQV